jgi:hypothetical protein
MNFVSANELFNEGQILKPTKLNPYRQFLIFNLYLLYVNILGLCYPYLIIDTFTNQQILLTIIYNSLSIVVTFLITLYILLIGKNNSRNKLIHITLVVKHCLDVSLISYLNLIQDYYTETSLFVIVFLNLLMFLNTLVLYNFKRRIVKQAILTEIVLIAVLFTIIFSVMLFMLLGAEDRYIANVYYEIGKCMYYTFLILINFYYNKTHEGFVHKNGLIDNISTFIDYLLHNLILTTNPSALGLMIIKNSRIVAKNSYFDNLFLSLGKNSVCVDGNDDLRSRNRNSISRGDIERDRSPINYAKVSRQLSKIEEVPEDVSIHRHASFKKISARGGSSPNEILIKFNRGSKNYMKKGSIDSIDTSSHNLLNFPKKGSLFNSMYQQLTEKNENIIHEYREIFINLIDNQITGIGDSDIHKNVRKYFRRNFEVKLDDFMIELASYETDLPNTGPFLMTVKNDETFIQKHINISVTQIGSFYSILIQEICTESSPADSPKVVEAKSEISSKEEDFESSKLDSSNLSNIEDRRVPSPGSPESERIIKTSNNNLNESIIRLEHMRPGIRNSSSLKQRFQGELDPRDFEQKIDCSEIASPSVTDHNEERRGPRNSLTGNLFSKYLSSFEERRGSESFLKTNSKFRRMSENSYSKCMAIVSDKLSALLHDFKNVVHDNTIFFEYIVNELVTETHDKDKIEDFRAYLEVSKNYIVSLVLNITNFISNNTFLVNEANTNIDIIYLVNVMKNIFTRRLEYDKKMSANTGVKSLAKKEIKIRTVIDNPTNPIYHRISSNSNLMISLLYNILSNSYKYTDHGEIVINLTSEIYHETGTRMVLIKISDTGQGIPPEILKNWGKTFNYKDKSKGTGLGQFLIHTIASNLGLYIPPPESSIGNGTTFKIYIPVEGEDLNNTSYPNNLSSLATIRRNSALILEDVLKKLVKYDEEDGINNPKTAYIMCLDDDNLILSSLSSILSRTLSSSFKTEIVVVDSVPKLFNEVVSLSLNNIFFDVIIFDQNVNHTMNGVEVANFVYKIYSQYKDNPSMFYFVTEDVKSVNFQIDNGYKMFKKENIFTKTQFLELSKNVCNYLKTIK